MASLASTTRRITKHKVTRRAGWLAGLAVATAAAVGGLIYYEKTAKAAPKVAPPGPTPAGTVPVWAQLTAVANPSLPGTFMVNVPANATFAFADDVNDPNLGPIVSGLNAAIGNGTITGPQNYPSGAAPAQWPNDGFANGYRVSGVASQAFALSLGALSKTTPTNPPSVWIITGFQ